MKIIGERLNGWVPSVQNAIAARDGAWIRQMALRQEQAGADALEVCASLEEEEPETLRWMIEEVQAVTDLPLSLDSPDVKVLEQAAGYCKKPGILNSVSLGREADLERMLFFLKGHPGWRGTVMLSGPSGLPKTAEERLELLERLRKYLARLELDAERIYVDPVVEAAAFGDPETERNPGVPVVLETISEIRRRYPGSRILAAVSNVSYGLPARSYVNRSFAVLALAAGADALILDPLDEGLRGTLSAARSLLSLDGEPGCMQYVKDYRKHLFS